MTLFEDNGPMFTLRTREENHELCARQCYVDDMCWLWVAFVQGVGCTGHPTPVLGAGRIGKKTHQTRGACPAARCAQVFT
eukprot:6477499-Amphidinium_carterae.1